MTSEVAVIRPAGGAADLAAVHALFLEYAASLPFSLCFQGFDDELAALPGQYTPPRGAILLAEIAGRAEGVVALRPLKDDICEMKRMYLRPFARGAGIGRRLATEIMAAGRAAGYRAMRLDTHASLAAAIALYRTLGFVEIPAYYDNPMDGVQYYERPLG